jgi:regulator of RNase E activity RraA
LPIFARGTSLLTTKLNLESASELNVAVSCGGISVQPGDWVLGDDNGLLILPAENLLEVIDIALGSDEAEPDVLQRLRSKEPVERVLRLPHQST